MLVKSYYGTEITTKYRENSLAEDQKKIKIHCKMNNMCNWRHSIWTLMSTVLHEEIPINSSIINIILYYLYSKYFLMDLFEIPWYFSNFSSLIIHTWIININFFLKSVYFSYLSISSFFYYFNSFMLHYYSYFFLWWFFDDLEIGFSHQ